MNNEILITGGAGFIGYHLSNYLIKRGHSVRIFDLSEKIRSNPPNKQVRIYAGSILDVNNISDAINGCGYVIHLAAKMGVDRTEKKKLETLNINILGTRNILEECIKHNIKKILFSSSSEVYGDTTNQISETDKTSPKSVYGVSKLAGEEYIKAYSQYYGLNYTIVRYFNAYGPRQIPEFVMSKFIDDVNNNKSPIIYGSGKQIRCFCYIDDIINGTYRAFINENANKEIFNIGNNLDPIEIRELANKIIKLSGKNIKSKYITFNKSDRNGSREIYRRIPNISKAQKYLNYEPKISLDRGLRKMI